MERETLYKFFDGAASFEEEVAIRQWMESSLENKRIFLKERKLFDAMILLGQDNGKQAETSKGRKMFSSLRTQVLRTAAIVAITLGCVWGYEFLTGAHTPLGMQTIYVPTGQRVNITLPDGTNVWLNTQTTIKYPTVFESKKRQIILDGEAYFEVAKDKNRPFMVQTDKCNLEVLGTKFNVKSYLGKEEFETTLMEGSVKVSSQINPQEELVLAPDSKAYLSEGKLKVAHVDDYNPYRWKEGLICFRNESFDAIMKEFEKYYGVNIRIRPNKDLQRYFFTGKFRQTDGIDYALRVLQQDIRFQYSRDDENQIIYIE